MIKRSGNLKFSPRHLGHMPSGRASPLVGWESELSRLAATLTLVADRQGSVIFLTGQPGIGKTRLAHEALALAKECGFMILEGRAFPTRVGFAYAPLVDALCPLLRRIDSAHLQALVSGLPSLGRLFEGLGLGPIPFK